jgi:hypothetical protein
MNKIFRIAVVASVALLGYGTYSALVTAPTDAMQGDVYRIIYHHVPSGWTMFVFFGINFIASVLYLVQRTPKVDAVAVSAAEVGVVFCTVVLVTGPIWARPVWGIWWIWDARLTSTFVLYLIYISYLLFRRYSAPGSTSLLAAVVAIFGAADIPLVIPLDLVFSYATSGTRTWERRIHRLEHVPHMANKLCGIPVAWVLCIRSTVSLGTTSASSRGAFSINYPGERAYTNIRVTSRKVA